MHALSQRRDWEEEEEEKEEGEWGKRRVQRRGGGGGGKGWCALRFLQTLSCQIILESDATSTTT